MRRRRSSVCSSRSQSGLSKEYFSLQFARRYVFTRPRPKAEVAPFDERSAVSQKYCGRETAVVRHLRVALLSHIPSCVYRKLKPGRNDGEPADQPTSPLAIRVGRMQTVQRKNADRGKQ